MARIHFSNQAYLTASGAGATMFPDDMLNLHIENQDYIADAARSAKIFSFTAAADDPEQPPFVDDPDIIDVAAERTAWQSHEHLAEQATAPMVPLAFGDLAAALGDGQRSAFNPGIGTASTLFDPAPATGFAAADAGAAPSPAAQTAPTRTAFTPDPTASGSTTPGLAARGATLTQAAVSATTPTPSLFSADPLVVDAPKVDAAPQTPASSAAPVAARTAALLPVAAVPLAAVEPSATPADAKPGATLTETAPAAALFSADASTADPAAVDAPASAMMSTMALVADTTSATTLNTDATPGVVGTAAVASELPGGPLVNVPGSTPVTDTSDNTGTSIVQGQTGTPNKIALENLKQGTPRSEWGIEGDGDGNIQGFATNISTNVGGTVDFKIATDSTHYRIDIYRMGYYGGDGARKVASIDKSLTTAQVQPHPIVDMSLGLIDCGNWSVSGSWQIPTDAVSGVYFAKLVREDGTAGASIVPFVVRDDSSKSDIVFQTSDTTWQAYNAWGGASLYYGEVPVDPANMVGYMPPNCSCGLQAIGRASAVSYNRPIITNTSPVAGSHDFVFGVESSAISWLEQNGYDVSYISGVDTTRATAALSNHKTFLSVGHDEYWSAEQRSNVEAARDAGVNLAFWGGNDMYWKVRWESSIDGNGTPYRTMVCYKETYGTSTDPTATSTGTFRDPRYQDPGQKPENALIGTQFQVDSYRQDAITVSSDYSKLRFWRNTDVADLQAGQSLQLSQNLLGYEWNSDVENGYRPAGLADLSLSTVSVDTYLRDYGTTVGSATATHSLTMYRAASGALVFSAGTVFWSWGLNADHEGPTTATDPNVQQSMVNMFADMGIQPTTLDASLILATQSTDHVKPTSAITSPNIGASFIEGQRVTITGTAADTGGGVIAGVEVSTDGGQHWFKATGRENWTYSWNVQASGTYTIESRAVDDSLNLETPSAGKQVQVTLPTATTSLWSMASTPVNDTATDRDGVELGIRFQATNGGAVTGIRFYKGYYNAGQHSVSLWSSTGTLLATGVATNESISGWQTVTFSSPVTIQAGTTYVASYHSNGYYSNDAGGLATGYQSGQLKIQPGGSVFAYGAASTFPGSASSTNYWVDVVLNAGPNSAPVAVADNGLTVAKNGTLTISIQSLLANDSDPNNDFLKIASVGGATNGSVTLDTVEGDVIFTPTAGYTGAASFTYALSDGRGGTATGNVGVTVDPGLASSSVFQAGEAPTGGASNDGQPLELGMRFVASTNGTITGIRFYKPAGATGTHTGSIWAANGTQLATLTFTNESTSGWQTATLSTPLQVTAGTTYVASYHTTGAYVANSNYFTAAHGTGAVTAPASTGTSPNGLYAYTSASVMPTQSYQASNYWVDVVFNAASTTNTPPVAVNDNGLTATKNTPQVYAFAALTGNDTDIDGDVLTVTGVSNALNGAVAIDTVAKTVTFTPTTNYTGPASFNYAISDGRGGTSSATASLTVAPPSTSVSLYSAGDTPTTLSSSDSSPVELGVKFTTSAAGTITGMRYYKSAQDTGTHVGSLWTSTGTLLASATFTNETASGWQTVNFTQPVAVTAGTTYVASYQSNGHYASTQNYFASSHVSGQLTAPSSSTSGGNGVYVYGSGNEFPNASYNATNYWADVVYQPSTGNSAPVANNDSGFTTAFNTPIVFQASQLLGNDTDPDGDALTLAGVSNPVNGTLAFDSVNQKVTFTPTAGYSGTASFTYSISDGHSHTASAQAALTVSPSGQSPDQSVFTAASTPTTVSVNDTSAVNLGMKFTADVAGSITAVKFYKASDNTGPHTGYLWSSTGTLLASATFTNETASGWQSVNLSQPVTIQAGQTYVVSYSTNGHYSATSNGLSSAIANGNLHALSSALSGGNGVYAYGAAGSFPTASYNSTNYYVDVAFRAQLAA